MSVEKPSGGDKVSPIAMPQQQQKSVENKFGKVVAWIQRNAQYIPGLSQGIAFPKMIFFIGFTISAAKDHDIKGLKVCLLGLGRAVVSTVPLLGNLTLLVVDTIASKFFKYQLDSPYFNFVADDLLAKMKTKEIQDPKEKKLIEKQCSFPVIRQILKEKIIKNPPTEQETQFNKEFFRSIRDAPL